MSNPKDLAKQILIVDDNLVMNKMFKSMLGSLGYDNIVSASTGESGWQRIQEGGIDIVISDYVMPGLNGLDLLHRIRHSKEFFDLPFIMVTGTDNWGDFINTVQAEVDSYLIKPITADRLGEVLRQIHNQQRSGNPYLKAIHAGKHFYLHKEVVKAYKSFLLAQSLEPKLAKPYYYLGQISREAGRVDDAKKFYKKCLELEENYINATLGLVDIYRKANDFQKMNTYLGKAIETAPRNISLHIDLARASAKLGDMGAARQALKTASKIAKSNKEDVEEVVEAYIECGLLDEADYLFGKKLQDDDRETVKFWNRLGLQAQKNGDLKKGKFFFLSALKLQPQNKNVNFNIAKLLYEDGEYDSAVAYVSKALRLHADFPEANELLSTIKSKLQGP